MRRNQRAAALANLDLEGVSCHIGSQILDLGALLEAADKLVALAERLRSAGLGVAYVPGTETPDAASFAAAVRADVVGPVCETGDFLARDREVANVLPGDYLAVCTAGAYGFVSASNYNCRPRPPEVLVDGAAWRVVRARETFEDLVRGETP